jgi:hypothetical protein
MATCAHCETEETELYENGVPFCLRCTDTPSVKREPPATMREIGATLFQSLLVAASLNDEAAKEFDDAVSEARTGAHHPNGAQPIKDASSRLSVAREETMTAHKRLSDFIERGIVGNPGQDERDSGMIPNGVPG